MPVSVLLLIMLTPGLDVSECVCSGGRADGREGRDLRAGKLNESIECAGGILARRRHSNGLYTRQALDVFQPLPLASNKVSDAMVRHLQPALCTCSRS